MVGLQEASAVADADADAEADADADADADAEADEDGVWETTDPKTKKAERSLNIYTCFLLSSRRSK